MPEILRNQTFLGLVFFIAIVIQISRCYGFICLSLAGVGVGIGIGFFFYKIPGDIHCHKIPLLILSDHWRLAAVHCFLSCSEKVKIAKIETILLPLLKGKY